MSEHNGNPIHCDASILHAPGECEFCDKYGKSWQEYRELARINFTGHSDTDKAPCPSTYFRPTEAAHRWPGNRPAHFPSEGVTLTSGVPHWLNPDGTTSPITSGTAPASE